VTFWRLAPVYRRRRSFDVTRAWRPETASDHTAADLIKAIRPGRAVQRVNVDFPLDLLREIDQEARRLGVTRQAFIKVRLADALVKNQ
jgi:hypothetical protein